MKILDYIIPEEYRKNDFVRNVHRYFLDKGSITDKQENALRWCIGVEEDFFEYDVKVPKDSPQFDDFILLKEKYQRDRFRYTRTKNECIKAMQSIIYERPDYALINNALGRNYDWRRR